MNPQLRHTLDTLQHAPQATPVTPDEALELGRRHPYFTLPALLALRDTPRAELTAEARLQLMKQIALNSTDPAAAFLAADIDYASWATFYPAERTDVSSTDEAITRFLETYGHADPREEALLERLIFNPTPDYASVLERRDREEGNTITLQASASEPGASPSQDDLIASFILKHRDDESSLLPHSPAPEPVTPPSPILRPTEKPTPGHTVPAQAAQPGTFDSSLSESLAKIYIRQKRYDKAFEIIHTLSLNNPKKSSYFADQLRFLRKLMLNHEAGSR